MPKFLPHSFVDINQEKKEIPFCSPQLIELMQAVHGKGGVFRFKANGFSMAPFIKDGDVLTIAKPSNSYHIGEVVAFVRPCFKKLVVHRIVGKKKDKFLIKGDNSHEKDGNIPLNNILGKVIRVERNKRDVFAGIGLGRGLIAFFSRCGMFPSIFFLPCQILRVLRLFVKKG